METKRLYGMPCLVKQIGRILGAITLIFLISISARAESPIIQRIQLEPLESISQNTVNIGSTALAIPYFRGQMSIAILNTNTANTVYFGSSGVLTTNGYPLYPREELILNFRSTPNSVYFIGNAGESTNLRIFAIK